MKKISIFKFKIFYKELKGIYNLDYIEENLKKEKEIIIKDNKKNIFENMKIVFTGFRDKDLEEEIEKKGGSVSTSVSSKTSLVVYVDNEKSSSKLEKAKELEIETITKSDFIEKFRL